MIGSRTVALLAGAVLLLDVVTLASRTAESQSPPPEAASPASSPATETLAEQLERVVLEVELIRGIDFPSRPDVRYASRDALRAEVEAEIDDYTPQDADRDQRFLVALGQIAVGVDLRSLLIAAYGEQVAGFYDPETGELVVGTDDPTQRVGRLDEVTLAHELGHALVDAQVGLVDLEAFKDGQEDALVAAQALVEGDATVLMQRFSEVAMSPIDQILMAREALALADTLAAFAALPWVLRRSLEFPYTEGAVFVEHLLAQGGWHAVDVAHHAPPTTTLEILVPGLYGRTKPAEPAAFGQPGTAWTLERTMGFGAFDLLVLLEAPGGDPRLAAPDVRELATSWLGGQTRQWSSGASSVVALSLIHEPTAGLCDAIVRWYAAAFPASAALGPADGLRQQFDGPEQDAVIACDPGGVRVGIAPDLATATRSIAP